MKAVLMAGGEGTRLRPITSNQPKPMVDIFGKPVMEYIIELLKSYGIDDIIVTVQFLPQLIKNYYGEGTDLGVKLSYAIEEAPLGTAGSVKNAEEYLKEPFIVISGDAMTDINLAKAVAFHKKNKSFATLVLTKVKNPLEFGVVITDDNGRIERFLEKPNWGQVFSDTVNTGIYILEPEVLSHIPKDSVMDFSKDLFPKLLKEGYPLYGYVADGYWCDIGSTEQYVQVHEEILSNKVKVKLNGNKMRNKVWVGKDTLVDESVVFEGPAFIGQHCRIEAGAKIGYGAVVGNNSVIKSNARVNKAIIQDNAYIGNNVYLDRCVIGKNCDIKKGARVEQGVVIGDDCIVGEDAIIRHDVKIYPFKTVDAGATVNSSLIWESRGMRSLFGMEGISGISNVDIAPGLVARVAMAFGTSIPKESFVVASRDSNRVSRMVKRAMVAGLTSTGIHVRDLRVAPTPVNRFNVATSRCMGGFHVGISPFDPQTIQIRFFNKEGINLDDAGKKDIEKYYYREEFRRAFHNEFGEIIFPARTSEYYQNGLLSNVKTDVIKNAGIKLVIDYAFGSGSYTMPVILGKLGIDAIALNAFTDETHTTLSHPEIEQCVKRLSETVKLFKANLGILIDNSCEKIMVFDNTGRRILVDELLQLMVQMVCEYESDKGAIAVPLSVSNNIEKIASKADRNVIRTRVTTSSVMQSALDNEVVFAGTRDGGFIFPSFLPSYDGVMSICKLLEYMAISGKSLSKMINTMVRPYVLETKTFCSWENKGLVMRKMIENNRKSKMDLIDGVKIYDKNGGWTLVLPHPEEPIIRLIAEGKTKNEAKTKLNKVVKTIDDIIEANE